MGRIKDIKKRTYYFYDDMDNIKDFDSSLLKLEKKPFKNIVLLHWIYHKKKINTKLTL